MTAISDDLYFSRAATWLLMGEQVVVHDSFSPKAPRMITMEPWHEVVFMAADGEHTVGQFVAQMGAQYSGGTPAGLREQVHEIIAVLVHEGVIRIHPLPQPLPPYFASDSSGQDPQTRAAQMRVDGLLE